MIVQQNTQRRHACAGAVLYSNGKKVNTAAKRIRDIPIQIYVTADEMDCIEEKMRQMGTANLSAYVRKMALDGYVLRLDLPELREMVSLMRRMSNNINQVAKRANESGRIYETDISEMTDNQEKLWKELRDLMSRMSQIC